MDVKSSQAARLNERRDQLLTTLSYVAEQTREVEQNTEWKDPAAQRRRRCLLDDLSHWYLTALGLVDDALGRLSDDSYGVCLACNAPVEAEWLEACPETEFCLTCQDLRDKVA
jgi:DnaK suppressor protein